MRPDYESYLVINHPTIIDYYIRGIQVAIYHKDTKVMEVINQPRFLEFTKVIDESFRLLLDVAERRLSEDKL